MSCKYGSALLITSSDSFKYLPSVKLLFKKPRSSSVTRLLETVAPGILAVVEPKIKVILRLLG